MPTPARSALFTVFLVVLVDLIGFGIVLPLLPFYAERFGASSVAVGLLYSSYSFCQLIFSPLWGGLSDRIGRRPVMLASTLGASLSYVLFACSGSFGALLLSRVLAGAMGGNIATAQAYVADVTGPEDRAKGMGLIGAAFGIGFLMGPALAAGLVHPAASECFGRAWGWLGRHPYAAPGLFASALSAASFLLVLAKLPETVTGPAPRDGRRPLFLPAEILRRFADPSARAAALRPLLGCVLGLALAQSSLYSAFPLFVSRRLGLGGHAVGMAFAFMGLVAVLVQGALIRPLTRRFGEERLFRAGSVLMAAGLFGIPFAGSEPALFAVLGIMALGGSLNGPTLFSLVSKEAEPGRTGAVMGLSQGMAGLGRTIGPTWGGWLYGIRSRLPFFATAFLVALTLLAVGRRAAELRREGPTAPRPRGPSGDP